MANSTQSAAPNSSYKRVMNGVFIHERSGAKHGVWQLHARIDGELFRESLRTTDEDEAIIKAAKRADELIGRKYLGKLIRKVSFNELCDDYLASIVGEIKHGYHSDTIRRYYRTYFGSRFDDICAITPNDMLEYRAWRRAIRDETPAGNTLNRERSVFSKLMKHAVKRGYIKKENVVEQEREREAPLRDTRRYHFNSAQYNRLHRAQQKRINAAKRDPKLRGFARPCGAEFWTPRQMTKPKQCGPEILARSSPSEVKARAMSYGAQPATRRLLRWLAEFLRSFRSGRHCVTLFAMSFI